MKLIKIVFDVLFVVSAIGCVSMLIILNFSEGSLQWKAGNNHLLDFVFLSCFLFCVLSFFLAALAFYGTWDGSADSKFLRKMYCIPFLSVGIAYLRLRAGKKLKPDPPLPKLPWIK